MVFLDIGGHHGAFSLIIAHELKTKNYNSKVYTFKQDSRNIEFITKNLVVNGLSKDITIVSCAVSDKNGIGKFVVSSDNSCNLLQMDNEIANDSTSADNIKIASID